MESEIPTMNPDCDSSVSSGEKKDVKISSEKDMKKTIAQNGLKMRYSVSTRSKLINDSSKRIRRVINVKNLTHSFKCPKCPNIFSSARALTFHQQKAKHFNGKSVCPICGKGFNDAGRRKRHLKVHMQLNKAYVDWFIAATVCPYCNKCYNSRRGKTKHIKTAHSEKLVENTAVIVSSIKVPKSKCNVIKKSPYNPIISTSNLSKENAKIRAASFKRPSNLKKKATGAKLLTCYVCPTDFKRYANLTRHLRAVHGNLLKFQCSICKARFFSEEHAGSHLTKSHKSSKGLIIDLNESNGKSNSENSPSLSPNGKEMQNGAVKTSSAYSFESSLKDLAEPQTVSVSSKGQMMEQVVKTARYSSCLYSCSVCSIGNVFTCKGLKKHKKTRLHRIAYKESLMKAKQSGLCSNKNISCSVCKFSFGDKKEFVLHRMKHFVSEENALHSPESEANYSYQCEICGLTIISIRKIQFHLLWHAYTAKSISKDTTICSQLLSKKNSDSCVPFQNSNDDPQRLICFGCCNAFRNSDDFIKHKRLMESEGSFQCTMDRSATCLKYCLIHETEICFNDGNRGNNQFSGENCKEYKILMLDILPRNNCADNFNLMNSIDFESGENNGITTVPNIVLAHNSEKNPDNSCQNYREVVCTGDSNFVQKKLKCSLCGQINNTLQEFKSHSCYVGGKKSDNFYSVSNYNNDMISGTSCSSNCGTLSPCSDSLDSEDNRVKFRSPVEKSARKSCCAFINEVSTLREDFSNLLCLLIDDDQLMIKLGLGKKSIDSILEEMLKYFELQPLLGGKGVTLLDKLRHNIMLLLQLCVKDTFMKNIGAFNSVDGTVRQMLTYFKTCIPSLR